jgi:hypothetical protein
VEAQRRCRSSLSFSRCMRAHQPGTNPIERANTFVLLSHICLHYLQVCTRHIGRRLSTVSLQVHHLSRTMLHASLQRPGFSRNKCSHGALVDSFPSKFYIPLVVCPYRRALPHAARARSAVAHGTAERCGPPLSSSVLTDATYSIACEMHVTDLNRCRLGSLLHAACCMLGLVLWL